ncbi:MAG: hypothetical protein SAL70_35920, partial [Scytonema sp. PMC 1070.18]|nr:hypothetical protein [Scytonema sp. PMC 1070.18]
PPFLRGARGDQPVLEITANHFSNNILVKVSQTTNYYPSNIKIGKFSDYLTTSPNSHLNIVIKIKH